jgi:hypothetical protein
MRIPATALALGLASAACGTDPEDADGASTSGVGESTDVTSVDTTSGADDDGVDDDASSTVDPDGESSSAGEGETTGAIPTCELEESGPIVVARDGQIIENLHIVADGGPGIVIDGFSGVQIINVWIEHAGGAGIEITNGADDTTITDVAVEHTGAPEAGENPSEDLLNIVCYGSARLAVTNARLVRGSSGIYLVECPDAVLVGLEGHDFRGPFPRGQLVQFDKSDRGVLEDFSVVNPQDTSWPEDNVNVYQSLDVEIRRGLVDGNNSPSGVGVIFDGDLALGVVEDVDAVRMGNGCFSDYAGSDGVVFRRTRCRENICEDQGRGLPLSNALMWSGHEGFSMIRIEESLWFAACNDNLVWPEESFAVIELEEEDFELRAPIEHAFCWE